MNLPTVRARPFSVAMWMVLLASAASHSYAGPIGTWTETVDGAGLGIHNEIQVAFVTDALSGAPASLFDALSWTVADVGKTVTVTSIADDPDFLAGATTLTNGLDDWISLSYVTAGPGPGVGGGTTATESFVFGTTPDFAGFQIDAIALTVDRLTFQSPAPDPQFPYDSTAVSVTMRVDIYGTPETTAIPEPTAAVFVCSGLCLALASRRGRQIVSRPQA